MVQFTAFRRLLGFCALAACSLVFVAAATPASARSHHHHGTGRMPARITYITHIIIAITAIVIMAGTSRG